MILNTNQKSRKNRVFGWKEILVVKEVAAQNRNIIYYIRNAVSNINFMKKFWTTLITALEQEIEMEY